MPQPTDRHKTFTKAIIAVGSNKSTAAGSPQITVSAALQSLKGDSIKHIVPSRLFESPCFPEGAGPDFVNAVAELETTHSAQELLAELHRIEAQFGRTRVERWAARTLDLDLISFGGIILPDRHKWAYWRDLSLYQQRDRAPDTLILPHPRVQDRAFVLVPLADILPDWQHPVTGDTVSAMLARLPVAEIEAVKPL